MDDYGYISLSERLAPISWMLIVANASLPIRTKEISSGVIFKAF